MRALRSLEIAGHEIVVLILYFGMLVPCIFMVSWMHWNMREIALTKWAGKKNQVCGEREE